MTVDYTYHLNEIDQIAARVLKQFSSRCILLYGDMGAGKTTFVSALLKAMQSKDVASSPTFSIVNEYELPNNEKLYHFDFYRIESIEEAYNFGIEDYLYSNEWLFMEWPERINGLLPEDAQTITININDDNTRTLKLTINKDHTTKKYAANT